jgi:hypothetical protein
MRAIVGLFELFPWWAALLILGGFVLGSIWYFKWKFHKIVHEAILEVGSGLKDAAVTVHGVTAVAKPAGPSPYDLAEDDENFDPDLDGTAWDEDGGTFYSIDATIAPVDPALRWDPSGLAVVPADFEPEDPTDVCMQLGGLHSAEVFRDGMWLPLKEGDRTGTQRVKFLFAIPDGVRAVKFAQLVTYFGRVELPAPVPAAGRR